MQPLVKQRCFNHVGREAAARCPECGRYFCRECVTEHDDRLICASCLKRVAHAPLLKRPVIARLLLASRCALSVLLLWYVFFLIGEMLASLPDSFHEGTLWRVRWFERE